MPPDRSQHYIPPQQNLGYAVPLNGIQREQALLSAGLEQAYNMTPPQQFFPAGIATMQVLRQPLNPSVPINLDGSQHPAIPYTTSPIPYHATPIPRVDVTPMHNPFLSHILVNANYVAPNVGPSVHYFPSQVFANPQPYGPPYLPQNPLLHINPMVGYGFSSQAANVDGTGAYPNPLGISTIAEPPRLGYSEPRLVERNRHVGVHNFGGPQNIQLDVSDPYAAQIGHALSVFESNSVHELGRPGFLNDVEDSIFNRVDEEFGADSDKYDRVYRPLLSRLADFLHDKFQGYFDRTKYAGRI